MKLQDLTLYLHEANNTSIPSLQVLAAQGYEIKRYVQDFGNDPRDRWSAFKNNRLYTAKSPEALYG